VNERALPDVEDEFKAARALLEQGRLDQAVPRYRQALQAAPDFFIGRLHYARALDLSGAEHDALTHYFRAINDAQAKGRWRSAETTAPVLQDLVRHAMRYVDAGRRRLFEQALAPLRANADAADMQRIDACLSTYLGEVPAAYADARQKPKFLFFPGLPTSAYLARELFPWYAELEANTDAIRAEMLAVLEDKRNLEPFLKIEAPEDVPRYLGGATDAAPAWDAFFFYRHGKRYDDNCVRCPRTAAIVDKVPLVRIDEHAPEVCFSVLTPGTHILPHRGSTNTRLVTHLPLVVPDSCALNVGGELHEWQEGRCVTFDDTFEHEAWNRSAKTRVVLILDVWNPHLSHVECGAVTGLLGAIRKFNRDSGVISEE
jgi:aspartate beta-hydroxylase